MANLWVHLLVICAPRVSVEIFGKISGSIFFTGRMLLLMPNEHQSI